MQLFRGWRPASPSFPRKTVLLTPRLAPPAAGTRKQQIPKKKGSRPWIAANKHRTIGEVAHWGGGERHRSGIVNENSALLIPRFCSGVASALSLFFRYLFLRLEFLSSSPYNHGKLHWRHHSQGGKGAVHLAVHLCLWLDTLQVATCQGGANSLG